MFCLHYMVWIIWAWAGGQQEGALSDTHTPDTHPPTSPPDRLLQPSTNAQWSWTTLIWGIILYETDGWGQPLTERVKTTLRCPLWISMMENRLLKKIYVCSPLPQESPPPTPPTAHTLRTNLGSDRSNMSLWSDETRRLYSAANFVTMTLLSICKTAAAVFLS